MPRVPSGAAAVTSLSLPPAPVLVTVLVIVGLGLWHLAVLPLGGPSLYDEFYTLDRSAGFLRTGDWFTVVSESAPSFKKPPLQYWMTAGLLAAGLSEIVAIRLPSLIFVLGTLGATAAMVRGLAPETPWAMPVGVLLLACSTQLWLYGNSGMLDTGARSSRRWPSPGPSWRSVGHGSGISWRRPSRSGRFRRLPRRSRFWGSACSA